MSTSKAFLLHFTRKWDPPPNFLTGRGFLTQFFRCFIIQLALSWNTLLAADLLRQDPSYLEPFYSETWNFQSATKTVTVTFNSQVTVSSITAYVSLDAIAEDGSNWRLMYDTDGYGLYHSYKEGELGKEESFEFQFGGVNNTEVSGTYHVFIFKSIFDSVKTDPIPMTGKLVIEDGGSSEGQPTTNLGYDDGYKSGVAQCQADPASCGIVMADRFEEGKQVGLQQCQANPVSCETVTTDRFEEGKQIGLQQCQADPASCGIVMADRFEEGKQIGLQQCQADPASCGIVMADRFEEGKQVGLQQCQSLPASSGQQGIIEHLQAFYDFFLANRGINFNYPSHLVVPNEQASEWQIGDTLGYTVYLKDGNGNPTAYFEIGFTPTSPPQ